MRSMKDCLGLAKRWLFEYIYVVDTCTVTNYYLRLLMTLVELTALAYFYYHPTFSILEEYPLIREYQHIVQSYVLHIVPFGSQALALLMLAFYPALMCVVLLLKRVGPIRPLLVLMQVATYCYPLLAIKIVLETVSCIQNSYLPVAAVPLALLSLCFGTLVLALSGRLHRCLEVPVVIALEAGGDQYAIMAILGVRLAVLLYLFYPRSPFLLSFCVEAANFFILLSCLFARPQSLNYASFTIIATSAILFGLFLARLSFEHSRDIYDKADKLEDDPEEQVFPVLEEIQLHETQCAFPACKCHRYLEVEPKKLREFVYEYEEERLRRNNCLEGRLDYAEKCASKYQFRLSGLIRVYEVPPSSVLEEYQVFRTCQMFENNLRKQDKNYRYGEKYLNIHEEEQTLNEDILAILQMVRDFWVLILNFDGSTKFLTLILKISQAINRLEETYLRLRLKYDEEVPNFKYLYELFCALILNQKISEEDEIAVPQPVTYLITSGFRILSANNNFSVLVNHPLDHIVGTPYHNFIPQIYREPHKLWVEEFIGQYEDYEDKSLFKTFAVDGLEIKLVNMSHRILPRFMNGLQVFTMIEHPVDLKKKSSESFLFLVEKDSLFIKHVEPAFFDAVRFKVNQRSLKLLQEMSLNSIFEALVIGPPGSILHETALIPQFCEEFTYIKKNDKKATRSERHYTSGTSRYRRKSDSGELVFEYEILKNARADDPYVKILFQTKSKKRGDDGERSMSSVQKEIVSEEPVKGKEREFKSNDFRLPYFMVLQLAAVHALFLLIKDNFVEAFQATKFRFDFYVAYDYTILYSLGVTVGQNMLAKLQDLWIKGYGEFSQSFNAFEHIKDPIFYNYFLTEVTIVNHNNLYQTISQAVGIGLAWTQIYRLCLLSLILGGIAVYVVDFIFSMRYIFQIESQVGDLLLQFVVVDPPDIQNLKIVVDNFIKEVLNYHDSPAKAIANVPVETVEESALDLMRGGSPNVSMMEGDDYVVENRSGSRRRSSNLSQSERRSLIEIKQEFKENNRWHSASLKKSEANLESIREENIVIFKQQYGSCSFILRSNVKLFLVVFLALTISCATVASSFLVVYPAVSEFRSRVIILEALYYSKIIMLKELIGISISNSSLEPTQTVSENLLEGQQHLSKLSAALFRQYENEYLAALTSNVCTLLPNPVCSWNQSITAYGLNVMVQQIEEYFRLRDKNAIKAINPKNSLIMYNQALFNKLIMDYLMTIKAYKENVIYLEMCTLILGTFGLLLGLSLSYYSLREFQNRIKDSKALLKIIPQEIKDKHVQALDALLSDKTF